MRILIKAISAIAFVLGVFLIWMSIVADLGFFCIVVGICAAVAGVIYFQHPGGVKWKDRESVASSVSKSEAAFSEYSFNVAGVSLRQADIRELCFENDDYSLSKRDLIEYGLTDEPVYMYESAFGAVSLVPDPGNKYDKNAIKVMRRDILLGYVPADEAVEVGKLISINYEASATAYGGPYKIVHEEYDGSYTVEKEDQNVGLKVSIKYE